eukprot:CAMPEP_0168315108 /NCGR_PEP_ID=MMETSP0210-20121227/10162_1 /TAXON_ID=40633 /ORGANISM="Condylostoma magnum, Strain COL2" /LENGTH=48 /DNA_ID= /DNA_START= /DNA_END= /DNA_ORIENTATION=
MGVFSIEQYAAGNRRDNPIKSITNPSPTTSGTKSGMYIEAPIRPNSGT